MVTDKGEQGGQTGATGNAEGRRTKGEDMTTLKKAVKRETSGTYRGRPIIIQIEPPSIIKVKEKGRHQWYETTVEAVFTMAAKAHAANIIKERKARKRNPLERALGKLINKGA